LFKKTKFHHAYTNDPYHYIYRATEQVVRVAYKIFYFYIFPILVIPIGVIAWRFEQGEDIVDNKFKAVDFKEANSDFHFNMSMQIYMYIILIIFFLAIYGILKYVNLKEKFEKSKKIVLKKAYD
jgi:hypothetical protein